MMRPLAGTTSCIPPLPHRGGRQRLAALVVGLAASFGLHADTVFETTSAYHRIRVVDGAGVRALLFDRAEETRMSLANPLEGHFEYIEYFFMPWLWNPKLDRVLMIGLGGGSAQRLYSHYCPDVAVDTVEVDAAVRQVAEGYFGYRPGPRQRIFIEDGRQFLRRSQDRYGAILLDAYTQGRYGAAIPHHLVTREFFTLVRDRLTTNGVVAYNVMGSLTGWRADIVGAVHRTMQSVFPLVYLFPASESQNVVLLGTLVTDPPTLPWRSERGREVFESGRVKLPTFYRRINAFRAEPPPNAGRCPVLTDDYAPVDGLLSDTWRR